MNILQISVHDHGGCAYTLAEAIRQTTEHRATSVRQAAGSYIHYPSDLVAADEEALMGLWKWADVVHVHDLCPPVSAKLPPRPTVVTYHGSMYRRGPKIYNEQVRELGWVGTVATIDLMAHGLGWMPDCRPDMRTYSHPAMHRFVVAHAPTSRAVKGTTQIEAALEGLERVELDIIEGVDWATCLTRKGRARLYIDQFELCYGLNAIEAWLMGMPVIANASQTTLSAIEQMVGHLPFVACNIEGLADMVVRMRDDKDFYARALSLGLDCATRFHTYRAAAQIALSWYAEALAMPKPALPPSRKAQRGRKASPAEPDLAIENLVALHYVGGNWGKETFHGPVTNQAYTASMGKPDIYVDERDAPGLLALKRKNKREFVRHA